ncbi:unnamed protein product [Blumeria hordei]|uniref:Fungal-type protein kinase domain-containing protein n=1 Tax=Blumeria hordei TaxID=2867405 RepID=A0A383UNN5_BLUHO|nr:unnamed protein product [Blumeria hordei]
MFTRLYLFIHESNDDSNYRELGTLLHEVSTGINQGKLPLTRFSPLAEAIESDSEEQIILKIAFEITLANPPEPTQTQPSNPLLLPKPSHINLLRNISESKGYNENITSLTFELRNELQDNVTTHIKNIWSPKTKRIWNSYKEFDENLKQKCFNQKMSEDQIWSWLEMFKEKFLNGIPVSGTRSTTELSAKGRKYKSYPLTGHYCRTVGSGQLTVSENPRQLDFLIKSIDLPLDAVTDWKDIGMIGEFSVQSVDSARKEKFEKLTSYAREIFSSQPLRRFLHGFCLYKTDLELWLFDRSGAYSTGFMSIRDSQEYLVRAISSYILMSKDELGFDNTIKEKNGVCFVQVKKEGSKSSRKFRINPVPIIRPRTLMNRGTICFETIDKVNIIKYSWNREPEDAEVKLLKDPKGVEGVVEYVMSYKFWQIKNHVSGPQKPSLQPFQRNRHLTRLVITPRGYPLRCSRTILEFLVVLRDCIVAHRPLYSETKILHCDISEGNIVFLRSEGDNSIQGMLIDLDYAVSLNDNQKNNDNSLLTGTRKFMALEKLEIAKREGRTIQCMYGHDLKSFLYVFLVGCIDFFELKNLARKLQNTLFGESLLELRTPDNPNPMYEGMIEAFNNTIEQIRGKINLLQYDIAGYICSILANKLSIH